MSQININTTSQNPSRIPTSNAVDVIHLLDRKLLIFADLVRRTLFPQVSDAIHSIGCNTCYDKDIYPAHHSGQYNPYQFC